MRQYPLTRERTEAERLRRHLHGDSGAKFSQSKAYCLNAMPFANAVTTFVAKEQPVLVLCDLRYYSCASRLRSDRHRLEIRPTHNSNAITTIDTDYMLLILCDE